MLSACHDRMQRQCATLKRPVPYLAEHGADEAARKAAANVMRYFDTSAKHHHADEEEDLFPALIESMAGSDAVCLRELTERLKADHRALEMAWQCVRTVLEKVARGESVRLTPGRCPRAGRSIRGSHRARGKGTSADGCPVAE
jgi:iron-sulfur cluster repair protein YtfE (RIC family)